MRDTKSLLLLLVSLLLVLVSFVLIWTWGYSFYSKNNDIKSNIKTASIDSVSIANKIKDSLQKVFTATLHDLDLQLDSTLTNSDSLKTELDVKLAEFYRLRSEITVLLKNRNTDNNFAITKQKIGELQTKADDLKIKNQDVESENKKLNDVLNQLSGNDKNSKTVNSIKNNTVERSNPVYQPFTASDLRLSAIMNAGEKEIETNVAAKTDKLNGSFAIINFNSQLTNVEMMVVVTGPEGRVLKNSDWDSGTFNTPDGKKIYSYKFNFSYPRAEAKRMFFSLRGGNLSSGNYIMEIYHNGLLIGRTVKLLS